MHEPVAHVAVPAGPAFASSAWSEFVNRLRWHLHELDPELQIPSRGLRRYCVIDDLSGRLSSVEGTVPRLAQELLTRCRELTVQINGLEKEPRDLVRVSALSLLAIPGCGVLGAAMTLGETAPLNRVSALAEATNTPLSKAV